MSNDSTDISSDEKLGLVQLLRSDLAGEHRALRLDIRSDAEPGDLNHRFIFGLLNLMLSGDSYTKIGFI